MLLISVRGSLRSASNLCTDHNQCLAWIQWQKRLKGIEQQSPFSFIQWNSSTWISQTLPHWILPGKQNLLLSLYSCSQISSSPTCYMQIWHMLLYPSWTLCLYSSSKSFSGWTDQGYKEGEANLSMCRPYAKLLCLFLEREDWASDKASSSLNPSLLGPPLRNWLALGLHPQELLAEKLSVHQIH